MIPFKNFLPIVVADLVHMIAQKQDISKEKAEEELKNSKLYGFLENEETEVWTYSTTALYYLWEQEKNTGIIQFSDV